MTGQNNSFFIDETGLSQYDNAGMYYEIINKRQYAEYRKDNNTHLYHCLCTIWSRSKEY